jgi:hypothetical protein
MKPSEELMLLLELNGFDVKKFKLKKQLEYEKSGNIELYKHKTYADLVESHYLFKDNMDYFHRNPLIYRETWGEHVVSVDQFYFKHPELDYEMTLREFMELKSFNEVQKESILYDVFDGWVEEYREASITQMENLREMIKLLPKKRNKRHKAPGKVAFLISVLFLALLAFIFKSPDTISGGLFSFISGFVTHINGMLYDVAWYSFLGWFTILLTGFYAVFNNFLARFIKDVRGEKNKHAERTFDKWEEDMKKVRLQQSGLLEDYVDRLIDNPKKSFFSVKSIIGPEILMDKFKRYVSMVENKYDWMTKNYKKLMRWGFRVFLFMWLFNIAFYLIGFASRGGWINV